MGARFVYRPFNSEQMAAIGQRVIIEVVRPRIASAVNVQDSPAKALSAKGKRYQRYLYIKKAKGGKPIRDLTLSGNTMGSLRVVSSTANQVRIGFDNPKASRIAAINQRREPMFWFSPQDQERIGRIVSEELQKSSKLSTTPHADSAERRTA